MDNLTHSLIGVGFYRTLPKKIRTPSVLFTSILGNNLPDLDILTRALPGAEPLDYLVHHRGYTHSFLYGGLMGLTLGALVYYLTNGVLKRGRTKPSAPLASPHVLVLMGIGMLSSFLHVLADGMNNYGIHPLTPFHNVWWYGDAVFIIEPLLFFVLLFDPIFSSSSRTLRVLKSGLVVALTLALSLFSKPIWLLPALAFLLFGAWTLLVQKIQPRLSRIHVLTALAVIALFFSASHWARRKALDSMVALGIDTTIVLDVVRTPIPTFPLCWMVWVRTHEGTEWVSRLASISLAPRVWSPERCALEESLPKTASIQTLGTTLPLRTRDVVWMAENRLLVREHDEVKIQSCRYRKFLTFARLPFLKREGAGWIAGDLRYDRSPGLDFAETVVNPGENCDPKWNAPWHPPSDPT